jgi:hypothetical protein
MAMARYKAAYIAGWLTVIVVHWLLLSIIVTPVARQVWKLSASFCHSAIPLSTQNGDKMSSSMTHTQGYAGFSANRIAGYETDCCQQP